MKRYLLLATLALTALVHAQVSDTSFLPIGQVDQVIKQEHYTAGYVQAYKKAVWVAYYLEDSEVFNATYRRTGIFQADASVRGQRPELSDYRGSGYDRGHLAPAADMSFSALSISDSFLLTNIAPQEAGFNRGIWKRLESLVRTWAVKYGGIYVVTGSIIYPGALEIGQGVDVPGSFYKAIYSPDRAQMIGFLLPHESSRQSLKNFAVSVDRLERVSGLDMFASLDDPLEEKLEASNNPGLWIWKSSIYYGNRESARNSEPAVSEVVDSGIVKKSRNNICHAPGSTYYNRTKSYTAYQSVEECLASGARLPKN